MYRELGHQYSSTGPLVARFARGRSVILRTTDATITGMAEEAGDITRLLRRWEGGDAKAFEELTPLAYDHLRAIAGAYLGRERAGHTLQPTDLVHELYFRLMEQRRVGWNDRRHFYTFAAKLMRMILIDHARAARSEKRGGSEVRVSLNPDLAWIRFDYDDLTDLNAALDELRQLEPLLEQLVEIRFFLGCTSAETAEVVGISKATVDRNLQLARSWLFRRLRGSEA